MLKKLIRSPLFSFLIKASVLVLVLRYFYTIASSKAYFLDQVTNQLMAALDQPIGLSLVVLLMPVNWWLEAKKWQLVCQPIQHLTMSRAFRGVLAGMSMGLVTPHHWGDYAGRIWHLSVQERHRALGAIMLSRGVQMLPTLAFGLLSLLFLKSALLPSVEWTLTMMILVVLIVLIFREYIQHWLKRWTWINVINEYSWRQWRNLSGLATARYAVFFVQFLLVMQLTGVEASLGLQSMGIAWIYFAKSILPAFNFLSDLGIREFAAVYFFEPYQVAVEPIVAASLLIWMINILVPSLVGLAFVWQMRVSVPTKSDQA